MARCIIYQLTRGGEGGPAIHVAEVAGRTEQLVQPLRDLADYEVRKRYIDAGTKTIIYSFVKHDARSTRNLIIQEGAGEAPETLEANAMVKNALTRKPLAGFAIQVGNIQSPEVLQAPDVDLRHLAACYHTE